MQLRVGTFNLNNLFSRYNFALEAEVPDIAKGTVTISKIKTIVHKAERKEIDYKGIALHRKEPKDRDLIVARIKDMDLDVLCVQEIEDIDTLRHFASTELAGLYPHTMLIEGNDPRLIDVAVMSKLPIGAAVTWQTAVHPANPSERVFSRDLLQAQILSPDRKRTLFTVFVTHLKSKFVPHWEDQTLGTIAANNRRKRQAESAAAIIARMMRPDSPYAVLGDFNDTPDAATIAPLVTTPQLGLVNGVANAKETRPAPHSSSPPPHEVWTHRFKPSGEPAHYELLDHIWLSPALAPKQTGAFIERRQHKITGDGSDHDPAWVELSL